MSTETIYSRFFHCPPLQKSDADRDFSRMDGSIIDWHLAMHDLYAQVRFKKNAQGAQITKCILCVLPYLDDHLWPEGDVVVIVAAGDEHGGGGPGQRQRSRH